MQLTYAGNTGLVESDSGKTGVLGPGSRDGGWEVGQERMKSGDSSIREGFEALPCECRIWA
jgi:hypothetical protein